MQADDVRNACRLLFSTTSASSRHDFRVCARKLLSAHPIGGAETLAEELHTALFSAPENDLVQAQRTYQRHALALTVDFPVLTRPLWDIAFTIPCTGRFAGEEAGRCLAHHMQDWFVTNVVAAPKAVIEGVTRAAVEHCTLEPASPWRQAVLTCLLSHLTCSQRAAAVKELRTLLGRATDSQEEILRRIRAITNALIACSAVDGEELVAYSSALSSALPAPSTSTTWKQGRDSGGASLLIHTPADLDAVARPILTSSLSCLSSLDAVGQALLLDDHAVDDVDMQRQAVAVVGPWRPCNCALCQRPHGGDERGTGPSSSFCLQPLYVLCGRASDPLRRETVEEAGQGGSGRKHRLSTSTGRGAGGMPGGETRLKRARAPSMACCSGWATMPIDILHEVMSYLTHEPATVDTVGSTCKGWREPMLEWRGWKGYFAENWTLVPQAQCSEAKLACAPLLPPCVRCTCPAVDQANGSALARQVVDRSHNWRSIAVARLRAERVAAATTRKAGLMGAQLLSKGTGPSIPLAVQASSGPARASKRIKPASAQLAEKLAARWMSARASKGATSSGIQEPQSEDGRSGDWLPCVCDVCTCAAVLPSLAAARAHLKEHHGLDRQATRETVPSSAGAAPAEGKKKARRKQGMEQNGSAHLPVPVLVSPPQAQIGTEGSSNSPATGVPWWYIPAEKS